MVWGSSQSLTQFGSSFKKCYSFLLASTGLIGMTFLSTMVAVVHVYCTRCFAYVKYHGHVKQVTSYVLNVTGYMYMG